MNAGGTPTVAHWTSIGVAVGFIVSGTFNTVLALCAFFFVANYTLSFLSVFALRRKEPDTPRPWRVPGYPFTTGLARAGLGGVPGRVGGERLGQQLEVDAAAGAQLSGVSGRGRETASARPSRLAVRLHPRHRPPAGRHLRRRDHLLRPRPSRPGARAGAARGLLPGAGAAGPLALMRLPPDPEFPDSTFVEDAAIVTSRGAILTRPGAPSRAGEVAAVGAALEPVVSRAGSDHAAGHRGRRRRVRGGRRTSSSASRSAPTRRGRLSWPPGWRSAGSGRA